MLAAHSSGDFSISRGQIVITADASSKAITVPKGVTKMSFVLVGRGENGTAGSSANYSQGSGGYGGDLRWINDLPVTPGETLNVVFTTSSVSLQRSGNTLVAAANGSLSSRKGYAVSSAIGAGPYGGTIGGANGGVPDSFGGGGGAAGYGNGSDPNSGAPNVSGGGGQGVSNGAGSGGGGVGLKGQGAGGADGTNNGSDNSTGKGGSSGGNGGAGGLVGADGGSYGGGGGGGTYYNGNDYVGGSGGPAALRGIYGAGRSFPSTNTGDM